ncbi:MAG: T9SS type A sorting domain-containing protein [Flavobacteriales bacterium]|nr:T9SS type A sorting domain-containing protein [Flavobacteriales bacterium]
MTACGSRYQKHTNRAINYTITDLLGKVQASGSSTSGGVNVRELASGLYTLKVITLVNRKACVS